MMSFIPKFLVLIALTVMTSDTANAQFSRTPYAPGEVLVKLKSGSAKAFYPRTNTRRQQTLYRSEWTLIKLPKGLAVEAAQTSLLRDPAVEAVQPNFYYYLDVTPNDPEFGSLWGMTKISAPAAWDATTGSPNTIVAVIDTGIKYTHPDLAANIWTNPLEIHGNNADDDSNGLIDDVYGYDFFSGDSNPDDEYGHGTHVAGTIGAVGNNALGVTGVNWNVKLLAVKIYDSTGFGTTSAMLINAYNYVAALRLRGENIVATNNSYSGCDEACGFDQATKDALDALGAAGVLNVFAAGNNARSADLDPAYPGSYDSASVLTVAASEVSDARASFSNFGTGNVDLAAPGSGILSTTFDAAGYGTKSGTSMASPHVAGAAALLASHSPGLTAAGLKATLMNSVDQLPEWNGVVKSGGRLNVANALSNQTLCEIALNPEQQQVFPEGGNFEINVTAGTNCDYEISKDANASFVDLTTAGPGSGNSTVFYSAASNTGPPRAGKIIIGGREFEVGQIAGKLFPHRGFLDFGGDGMTDLVTIDNVNGQMVWHVDGQSNDFELNFGLFADDIPIPGHYDSDLINDIAVWRRSTGTFYVFKSSDASVEIVQFGLTGDNPLITQDFDGDGIYDFAVVRPQNGKLVWYILRSTDGGASIFIYGNDGDIPIRGDYDGDGKADPAVYRPSTGSPANTFFVLRSSDQVLNGVNFGNSDIDELVPNDYDGDGKTDFAVWRPSTGVWHIFTATGVYYGFQFGLPGDKPTPGDYDGDGRTDFSVWRPGQNGDPGTYYKYSVWQGFSASSVGNDQMIFPAEVVRTR